MQTDLIGKTVVFCGREHTGEAGEIRGAFVADSYLMLLVELTEGDKVGKMVVVGHESVIVCRIQTTDQARERYGLPKPTTE